VTHLWYAARLVDRVCRLATATRNLGAFVSAHCRCEAGNAEILVAASQRDPSLLEEARAAGLEDVQP
jgi:hypothetical protein